MNRNSQQKGFALLIGLLVTTILLSVTYAMFSISLKQLTLSTAGKNSQLALYAADTGIECALFADINVDQAFVTVAPRIVGNATYLDLSPSSVSRPTCNDKTPTYSSTNGGVVIGSTLYPAIVTTFRVSAVDSSCADVTVSKYKIAESVGSGATIRMTEKVKTNIKSRGYNTCTSDTDPTKLERGLEVSY